jgi:predicted porin
MKKSLLALAVLGAFAGAAAAQSSVTIYGKLDMGLIKANKSSAASFLAGAPSNDELQLNEQAGSRLGFRGSEDLGGGLRANFAFEHRFTPDTGQANATFWNGFSWVGLSGGFGELRLGRDYAPAFWPALRSDPWGFDTIGQVGGTHAWATYLATSGVRSNNQIQYRTPNLSGFTASVAVSLSETPGTSNSYGFNAIYSAGPLYLGLGYDRREVGAFKNNVAVLTGAYKIGDFTPVAAYTRSEVGGQDLDNITLGLNATVGAGDLRAAVTRLNNKDTDIKTTKFGLGYHYPLSKRTKVYADMGTAKTTSLDRRTGFDFGLQHNF